MKRLADARLVWIKEYSLEDFHVGHGADRYTFSPSPIGKRDNRWPAVQVANDHIAVEQIGQGSVQRLGRLMPTHLTLIGQELLGIDPAQRSGPLPQRLTDRFMVVVRPYVFPGARSHEVARF